MCDEELLREIRKIRRLLEGQPGEPIPLPERDIPSGTTHVTINIFFGGQTQNNADKIQVGAQGYNARSENNAFEQQKLDPADLLKSLERIISNRMSSKNEDD